LLTETKNILADKSLKGELRDLLESKNEKGQELFKKKKIEFYKNLDKRIK